MKGAPASLASRRAISVLPTPVGPIMRIFLGSTSSRKAFSELQPPPSISQGDGDRAFGVALADDEAVEFGDDLARRKSNRSRLGRTRRPCRAEGQSHRFEGLDRNVVIGIDADFRRDRHRLADDGFGVEVAVAQCPRGRKSVIAPRPDAHHAALRFEHVPGAGQQQRDLAIGDQHHGFQPPQIAIRAPVLGELDGRTGELAGILFKLGLKPLEQRERIGGRPGKTANDLAVAEPPDFLGVGLDDCLADADLAVPADRHHAGLADRQDGGGVPRLEHRRRHGLAASSKAARQM